MWMDIDVVVPDSEQKARERERRVLGEYGFNAADALRRAEGMPGTDEALLGIGWALIGILREQRLEGTR